MGTQQKAFTLIELLVVISIIALLSSVVLASLNEAKERARVAALAQYDANVYHAIGDSLVASWQFDEGSGTSIADSSGNSNGSPSYTTAGWTNDTYSGTGSAMRMNNTGGAIISSPKNLPSAEMTITAWVRIRTHKNYNHILQINWGGGSGGWILMTVSSNRAQFGIMSGGAQYNAFSNVLQTNVWHHLMATYDGQNIVICLDGKTCSAGTPLAGQSLTAAGALGIGSTQTEGDIDNLRVYSRSFSSP